ncbi:hypothetical protein HHK36_007132 [Tetracentron sinense]|uniref:TIR domain-containing protein n=1 Tax=Tetracentron sinense TaxID=13715 RepID=A0A834ZSZ2_TETSI|nr:hypothetical protein HHK36_007132 [Tetracentron sinense]
MDDDSDSDDSSTTTSSPSFKFRWDVFLSFSAEDTRRNFIDRLDFELRGNDIRTFLDDEELETASEIYPKLLTAIEDSATSIAVISKNYAYSHRCLEELAKILECRRLILPVFFEVDPSHVRHQKGPFEEGFRNLEQRFGEEKVVRWRKAMEKAGGISGWDSKNWSESKLIQSLVEKILIKLSNIPLGVAKHPIGINIRVEELMRILDVKANGVQIVGFHGMGGIGKTTLAKAIYNKIVVQFKHRSFISNIRETSRQRNGLISLQNKLVHDLCRNNVSTVDEVNRGIVVIKEKIHKKRVLVVLDDVDDASQLDALAGRRDWFYEGSRIIITTRDNEILKKSFVNEIYEVKILSDSESLQLFSYHAFGRERPNEAFMHLSKQIIFLTSGLPLALEVFGAFLFDKRRIKEWKDALEKLKQIRPGNLQEVLKISFDGLNEQEKCIFLDIACFFVKMDMERDYAIDILKGCGFNAELAFKVLRAKSLIRIIDNNTLWMHDQLRDMGRQIVREESTGDLGKRSRLWEHEEVMKVLENDMVSLFERPEESELRQSLVKKILIKLSNSPLGVAKHPIGINTRVEEVTRILDVKSNGVRIVGFHGMGGIGKTTFAKAIYNTIVFQFEHRGFISNIRETSRQRNGLISLQKKLIRDLFPNNVSIVDEVNRGIVVIKEKIHEERVLVVLDDVDVMIDSESLQLFSYHTFGREKPNETFMHLSKQIIFLTRGLPLALEVFGAFLFDKRRIKEWEDALEKLKHIRSGNLQEVLKISFDGLNEQEKCIFLDIACFFVKMDMERDYAIDILKGCGFNAELAFKVLTTKSLIRIIDNNTLWMHDQLRDMGKQIVREESIGDLGKRSRLWEHDEIIKVLKNETGTISIQGIIFDFEGKNSKKVTRSEQSSKITLRRPNFTSAISDLKEKVMNFSYCEAETEKEVKLYTKPFEPMENLRLLQINHANLEGNFELVPAKLKWLQWKECPLEALPSDFCPRELAVLDLSKSKIKRVWGQRWRGGYKRAERLMVLNLHGCYNLTTTPDLSGSRVLEKLILERCTGLLEIHKSIGDVRSLLHLNLKGCSNLRKFPDDISGLRHLENLILSGCSKLKELPKDLSSMESLKELLVDETSMVTLPDSISCLKKLEKLSLNCCPSLRQLPISIGTLGSLRELSLNGSALKELPDSIGSLTGLEILSLMWCGSLDVIPDSIGKLDSLLELLLTGCPIKELPATIGSLSLLKNLSVASCQFLSKLPDSIGGLASSLELCLDKTPITELPDQIGNLDMLKKLEMRNCQILKCLPDSIGNMSSLTTIILYNSTIKELPESIGLLEKLEIFRANNCKQLCRLPASIGKLKCLQLFLILESGVTELPEEFGMLSSLKELKMGKRRPQNMGEHSRLTVLSAQENPKHTVSPTSFSSLSLLQILDARSCEISGIIPDDFEKLSSLEILKLGYNNFCSLPLSLRGLSMLKKLSLPNCIELKSLPPLPSSLTSVDVTNCTALESISDLSNLESLEELLMTNCKQVMDIPGLECLKSLKWLYMSGCNACYSAIKRRLVKVTLKHLRNLSVPGSQIPNWFIQEERSFSSRKNRDIKAVIICVVVSLDQQKQDDYRDDLPAIVDIHAEILRENRPIFTTALYLLGVPKTHEDQVYLCRYPECNPLVSTLKDGDKIQVTMRNPPLFSGLELKKYGIHLVFEDDDDTDDEDEESLDETKQSVSEKLAKFFSSDGVCSSNSGSCEGKN